MSRPSSRLALAAIFATVILDAAGIGLVLPVMPDLFARSGHAADGTAYGLFLSLYALMQFLCAPILGSLSDRIGRKPVLTVSLVGTTLNYAAMACLPPLWVLFVARAIAGMTGANMSVAMAYLADISEPEARAARFGQLSAAMGVGFILGPAAGGLLRDFGLAWPFIVAGLAAGLNLLLCVFVLPETRPGEVHDEAPDPFKGLREIGAFKHLSGLLMCGTLFALIGEVGGSVWVFYVHDRFHWQGMSVGLSLACFGLFHALVQAFIVGPATKRLGERGTLLLAMACDALSYCLLAVVPYGWMIFALTPFLCLGGMGPSVLAGLTSRRVSEDRQGQLQGVAASLASLAAIVGPSVFLMLYFATRGFMPGLVWLLGAGLYLPCLFVLLRRSAYAD
ncbi:TCR/Tet family MFS transporter [Asticcacaulis solisilvae]|uniref:TCR/Tet family MFS transporter n=1 Tax=Asticcacaulis solisilvae TaxID=1217274 RepID=UPI003FD75E89